MPGAHAPDGSRARVATGLVARTVRLPSCAPLAPRRDAGPMRVLVTGGAGFIGRPTVARLVAAGHDVTVLDLLRPDVHRGGEAPPLPGARLVVGDVRDGERARGDGPGGGRRRAPRGEGRPRDRPRRRRRLRLRQRPRDRRGAAGRTPRGHRTDRGLASSMVVYGEGAYDCPQHGRVAPGPRRVLDLEGGVFDPRCPRCSAVLTPTVVTEDAPLDPRNVYAATKVHGEHLLRAWARETSGGAFALRFHNVYGPGMPRDTPYAGVASLFRSSSPPVAPPGCSRTAPSVGTSCTRATTSRARSWPRRPGPQPLDRWSRSTSARAR